MRVRKENFRCDLCGQFADVGVTETTPTVADGHGHGEDSQTSVCGKCLTLGVRLLVESIE